MNQVTKALSPEELARVEARQTNNAEVKDKPTSTARLVGNRSLTKVVKLEYPVEFEGKIYDTLTVRRVKGKDFKVIARLPDSEEEDVALSVLLTGAPEEVIREMDGDDYVALQETIRDFLPRKLRTAVQVSETGPNTQQ